MKKGTFWLLGWIVYIASAVYAGQAVTADSNAMSAAAVAPQTPAVTAKATDAQQLAIEKCENDGQQKIIDEKLASFENRSGDLKWLITTSLTIMGFVIALMGAGVGFIVVRHKNEYKEAIKEAKVAAQNAQNWEQKAQAKYESIDKTIKEKIAEFEEKSEEKLEELKKNTRDQTREITAEGVRQRQLNEKVSKAFKALKDKRYDTACDLWVQIAKEEPDNFAIYNNWGLSLMRWANSSSSNSEQLYQQACEKFSRCIELKPDFELTFLNWALTLTWWAKLGGSEAEQLLQQACEKHLRAIEIKSDYHEAFSNWGTTLLYWAQMKEGEEAVNLLKQAESKCLQAEKYREGSGSYNLACIYAIRENEEKCKEWLELAEKKDTLATRQHAMTDEDLASVRDKEWFQKLKWKEEK